MGKFCLFSFSQTVREKKNKGYRKKFAGPETAVAVSGGQQQTKLQSSGIIAGFNWD
jgi:hypothetical protein